eukprot:gene10706-14374_t
MRSAESGERISSCILADRIASVTLASYQRLCPPYLRDSFNQTVLSSFVVQCPIYQTSNNNKVCETLLYVASIGVGTKVLPAEIIDKSRLNHSRQGDKLIRDMHAEIIARRGFRRFLISQYKVLIHSNGAINQHKNSNQESPFFELNDVGMLILKPGVFIHMYSSSQPCGNATIKRWAKGSKPVFDDSLCGDDFPKLSHNRLFVTARDQGQVALLVKKNCHKHKLSFSPNDDTDKIIPSTMIIPTGTADPSSQLGNIMTCSDKIALWNALGLQGTFLSEFYQPIYLSSITIGRKFGKVYCERALCCRLQDFSYECNSVIYEEAISGQKLIKTNEKINSIVSYSIHHPTMMGTAVKFDESVIFTSKRKLGQTADTVGIEEDNSVGAKFSEFRSFSAWYDISKFDFTNECDNGNDYFIEIIDGHTGLLSTIIEQHAEQNTKNDNPTLTSELDYDEIPHTLISSLSSYSMKKEYLSLQKLSYQYRIKQQITNNNNNNIKSNDFSTSTINNISEIHDNDGKDDEITYESCKTLNQYCNAYQLAKHKIKSDPILFINWIQK